MAKKTKRRVATPSQAREASGELRPRVPLPSNVEELFGGGEKGQMLRGEFIERHEVYAWFQKRHTQTGRVVIDEEGFYRRNGHEWKVPYGIRHAAKTPLMHCQMAQKYPWYVTWISPKSGRRMKKYFMSLARAIEFTAEKAQYADPKASIVSRHGYMIPPKLRNKIPKPFKWCPGCMTARKFYRVYPEQFIYAMIRSRTPNEKGVHEMKERRLPLLACRVCGTTTRDSKYRQSNQFWIVRRIKPGVRRVKRSRSK
jgi:hypothetical protein